jgi:hypothetical protein
MPPRRRVDLHTKSYPTWRRRAHSCVLSFSQSDSPNLSRHATAFSFLRLWGLAPLFDRVLCICNGERFFLTSSQEKRTSGFLLSDASNSLHGIRASAAASNGNRSPVRAIAEVRSALASLGHDQGTDRLPSARLSWPGFSGSQFHGVSQICNVLASRPAISLAQRSSAMPQVTSRRALSAGIELRIRLRCARELR